MVCLTHGVGGVKIVGGITQLTGREMNCSKLLSFKNYNYGRKQSRRKQGRRPAEPGP